MATMLMVQVLIMLLKVTGILTYQSNFHVIYGFTTMRDYRTSNCILTNVKSEIQCAAMCYQRNAICSFTQYNHDKARCKLYHWTDVGAVVTPSDHAEVLDTKMLIRSSYSHIILQEYGSAYDITFSEANDFCARLGGKVASRDDLTEARTNGWEFCRCGWLNDGYAYYWVSETSPSCGTISLHQCYNEGRTSFDVHCRID